MTEHEIKQVSDAEIKRVVKMTLAVLDTQWSTHVQEVKFTCGSRLSYCQTLPSGRVRLIFGLNMLRRCMLVGSRHHPEVRDWDTIVTVATHEFTHAVQQELGFCESREDWHDELFYTIFKQAYTQATPVLRERGLQF